MKGRREWDARWRIFGSVGATWKSGASAPRRDASQPRGFSPRGPQGLKASSLGFHNAALKGPLFTVSPEFYKCFLSGGFLLLIAVLFADSRALAQVTFERLVNSAKEPQNWMTYSGDYTGKRFSALDQINTNDAHAMVAKWVYQTGATGKLETTPLVVDGFCMRPRRMTAPLLSTPARGGPSGCTSDRSRQTSVRAVGMSIAGSPFWATKFLWGRSMRT